MTFSSIGKQKRLERLLTSGKMIVVPVDDSLILGPKQGLFNLENTIKGIASGKPNAIMGFKLAAEYVVESGYQIPFIYNLTASTLLSEHTRKTAVLCVENALVAGADCVAAHINFSSRYENEMLCSFSQIANECDRLGMPLLAIAYPRSERNGMDYNYEDMIKGNQDAYAELVAHCVRVVSELGADIIKTQYTGSAESFKIVTASAGKRPVVIAGGPKISIETSLKCVAGAIEAGGAGISFGRNIFNADYIVPYLEAAKSIIFNGYTWHEAISDYNKVIGENYG